MLLALDIERIRHPGTIEIYPGGAQDVWGIPRAARDIDRPPPGSAGLGLRRA